MIENVAIERISEADLARDVHAVLDKVQNGAEVVIDSDFAADVEEIVRNRQQ
jgi:anthranilate/para-aminobenzoate synthase component I